MIRTDGIPAEHVEARAAFKAAALEHLPALVEAMRNDGVPLSSRPPLISAVRIARSYPDRPTVAAALAQFETAIRSALVAYLRATPKAAWRVLTADALFLQEHFDRFTEVPVNAHWIQRVVIWARRKWRQVTQETQGHEH